MVSLDPVRELVVQPLTWLLAVPAMIAGWFGLGPVLQFVVETANLWFPVAALGVPNLSVFPDGLADKIVIAATLAYVVILGGRLLSRGVDRLKK